MPATRLRLPSSVLLVWIWGCLSAFGFVSPPMSTRKETGCCSASSNSEHAEQGVARRSLIAQSISALATWATLPNLAQSAVGSLPELANTNFVVQGLTVQVADTSQQRAMISFLESAFDFQILRQRSQGSIQETWMGFGPEELSIPTDFTLPVSSFAKYGGHASIRIVYDAKTTTAFYRAGDIPGNNVAYLQLGVPEYRISKMTQEGGTILDAYGIVNVISPAGLPIRGIVGISPDPIMFVAINSPDIQQSTQFYQQLGFSVQPYPYCRPGNGKGVFEPEQPKRSVYLAAPADANGAAPGMGVLLLDNKKGRQKTTVNPALGALHVVYQPSSSAAAAESTVVAPPTLVDPSGVQVEFQSVADFAQEEVATRTSTSY